MLISSPPLGKWQYGSYLISQNVCLYQVYHCVISHAEAVFSMERNNEPIHHIHMFYGSHCIATDSGENFI